MKAQTSEITKLKMKLKANYSTVLLLLSLAVLWQLPAFAEVPSSNQPHAAQGLGPNGCVRILSDANDEVKEKIRSPFIYHVMPWLFQGGLEQIGREIPKLHAMGVNTLWLGPIHPQTTALHRYTGDDGNTYESRNDHGYWPADHGAVAEELGGVSALKKLIKAAHENGVKVLLDAPLNHYGYGEEVVFEGQRINTSEHPDLFVIEGTRREHYDQLDQFAWTEPDILAAHDTLSRLSLAGLNDLDFNAFRVRRYLINSYKLFVDLGIDGIRLDAMKHLPRSFAAEFINELSNYAQFRSMKLTFLVELLIHDYRRFSVIKKDLLEQVKSIFRSRVYFIDFPFQAEFRRFDRFGHDFNHLMGFVRHREENAQDVGNLIPMLVDHDLGEPIRDAFSDLMQVGLGEFLSPHPLIIHHGNEGLSRIQTSRQSISQIDGSAEKTLMQKMIRILRQLGDYLPDNPVKVYHSEPDVLVIERTSQGRAMLFAVNKGSHRRVIPLDQSIAREFQLKIHAGTEDAVLTHPDSTNPSGAHGSSAAIQSELSLPGRSLAIYERLLH